MPRRELLLVDEAQQVGYLLGLEISPLVWNADSANAYGVVKNTINETSMSTATPNWCAQYSDVEYTRERAAIRSVFATKPRSDHNSRLNSKTCDFRLS